MASGELAKLYVVINAKIDDLQKALGEVKKELGGTKEEAEKANKSFKEMGRGFQDVGKALSITGAAITASLGLIVKQSANLGDMFYDLSQKTGISVETLSSFKLAADKSGTSIEGFATGMKGLANQMQDAVTKGGDSEKMFNALGVSIKAADGSLRPLDQVMLDVADRFSKMQDGAQKTALAQDLFGKSGMALIPMLNLGRAGLEDEAEAARRLGIVMSQETASASDAFNDSLTELQAGLQGVGQQITAQLLPNLTSTVKTMTDVVAGLSAWAKEHPGLTNAISGTALAIGGMLTGAGSFIYIAGTLMTKLANLATAFHTTAGAIAVSTTAITAATLAVGYYILKLGELAAAEDYEAEATKRAANQENILVDKLSEAAVAAHWQYGEMSKLIVAYDGNIAALTKAIQKGKEGKDIQEALAEVSKKHKEAIDNQTKSQNALNISTVKLGETQLKQYNLTALLKRINAEYSKTLIDTAIPAVNDLNGALGVVAEAMGGIPKAAEPALQETKNYFDGLYNDIAMGFGNCIETWLGDLRDFKSLFEGIWGTIKDAVFKMIGEMAAEWLIGFVKKAIGGVEDVAASVTKSLGAAAGGIADTAGKIAGGLLSSLGSIGSIITGITSVIELMKGPQKQTDVTYWLKMIKDNSQIIVNYLADTLVPATHNIEMLSYNMRDFLNDIKLTSWDQTEQLYKIAENTYGTWQALKNVIPAQSGVNTIASQPTLFMAHAGERVNISPNINMNMQAVPINLNINGKSFIRAVASDIYEMSKTRELKIHSNSTVNN